MKQNAVNAVDTAHCSKLKTQLLISPPEQWQNSTANVIHRIISVIMTSRQICGTKWRWKVAKCRSVWLCYKRSTDLRYPTIGRRRRRAFFVAGARTWNDLPVDITSAQYLLSAHLQKTAKTASVSVFRLSYPGLVL